MFRTTRTSAIPQSLLLPTPNYQTYEVVNELNKMFHGKCYLCEKSQITDIEVEHLVPHKNSSSLKFDWNNLFYSCSRCNSIKSTRLGIIDPTKFDVDKLIELVPPTHDTGYVIVNEGFKEPNIDIKPTLALINDCYNNEKTAYRGISKIHLMRDIMLYNTFFLQLRMKLLHSQVPLTSSQKSEIIQQIKDMCHDSFPYSAFWKWSVYKDSQLSTLIKIW